MTTLFNAYTNGELEKRRRFPKAKCSRYFSGRPSLMFPAPFHRVVGVTSGQFFSIVKEGKKISDIVELDVANRCIAI